MAHHHFTRDDRVLLEKLKTAGLNNRACARILSFHPSSVGRELRRAAAPTVISYDSRVARTRHRKLSR
jgi:IS30 family transposase